jgi:hypothetical protein
MHQDQESVCHADAKTNRYGPQELRESQVKHICNSIQKRKATLLKEQKFVTKTRDHPGQHHNITMGPHKFTCTK